MISDIDQLSPDTCDRRKVHVQTSLQIIVWVPVIMTLS